MRYLPLPLVCEIASRRWRVWRAHTRSSVNWIAKPLYLGLSLVLISCVWWLLSHQVNLAACWQRYRHASAPYQRLDVKQVDTPRIAIVTGATPAFLNRFSLAITNKQCFARLHGYEFIIDIRDWSEVHGKSDYWNRLWFLMEYVQACLGGNSCPDWIFYVDADAMVMNTSIPLSAFTDAVSEDIDLVLHDGADYINSGAFFIRPTEWSLAFLEKWRAQADEPQTLADQSALWEVLLELADAHAQVDASLQPSPAVVARYTGACKPQQLHRGTPDENCFTWDTCRCKRCLRRAERCWREEMRRLGHPYGQRRLPKVHFWSPDGDWTTNWTKPWPRGFNFYASVGHWGNVERCHPAQLWRLGDLLVQDAKGLGQAYATWWDAFRCPTTMTTEQLLVHLEASRGPTHQQLWGPSGLFQGSR